jgi:hypothetical protein
MWRVYVLFVDHMFIHTRCITLNSFTQVTDHGFSLLGKHCTALKSLDMSNCVEITQNGTLYVLVMRLYSSMHLYPHTISCVLVCACMNEPPGLKALLLATQLQHVNVGYSSAISPAFIFAMEKLHATSNLRLKIEKSGV